MLLPTFEKPKNCKKSRRTDLLTNTVIYRDVNVVFNSQNTQICASLPLITLKNAKKLSVTGPTDRPTDRQTDRQTEIATYRAAIAANKGIFEKLRFTS